jgi:glutathione peroxidase
MNLFEIPLKTIDGKNTSLKAYEGQALLIVNVASKCGLTPQYQQLETLYKNYKDKGFTVLGFPANDFGSQEPGSNTEIQQFCSMTYGVDFPMFEKIEVTGAHRHPLYNTLTSAKPVAENNGEDFEGKLKGYGYSRKEANGILWNFEKFVVNKKGEITHRFSPNLTPNDPMIVKAIEEAIK